MKEKINLSKNHKRVIGVAMKIVEKDLNELLILLKREVNESSYEVVRDIPGKDLREKIITIKKIKNLVTNMYNRYTLGRESLMLSNILETKKSYLWTVLIDSYSVNLNKYGDFNPDFSKEYDERITELIKLINQI